MDPSPPKRQKPPSAWWGCLGIWLVVFSFMMLVALTTRPGMDARQSRAHLGCKGLAQAIEAYFQNTSSSETKLTALSDLHRPPFGGQSLLRNGEADLIDPWGKPYEMERITRPDGPPFILVYTTAPDGTLVSQFGIGKHARPEF